MASLQAHPTLRFHLNQDARRAGIQFVPPRKLDAGFDIRCLAAERIPPGKFTLISTGLHLAIPQGVVGFIKDRSSVALRGGVTVAGVIDAGYRGEVKVLLGNMSDTDLVFNPGDKIAQCVLLHYAAEVECVEASSVEDLGDTTRGAGGFGSTGR